MPPLQAQLEGFAEVDALDFGVALQGFGAAAAEDAAFVDDVGAVGKLTRPQAGHRYRSGADATGRRRGHSVYPSRTRHPAAASHRLGGAGVAAGESGRAQAIANTS